MKKICICGSFGFGKESLNGQTIKTEIVTRYYQSVYGYKEVKIIDTRGFKNFVLVPIKLFGAFVCCKNIIILPAHNSLRLLAPLCRLYQYFAGVKTHYFIIGGWLPHYLKKHPLVFWGLKKFYGIYAETNTLKDALDKMELKNVSVVPNCKYLDIEDNASMPSNPPLKFCTFSRITKMKGIEDAVSVISKLNQEFGEGTAILDIYGRVDTGEHEWFDNLKNNLPKGVQIKGAIQYDKSVSILKNYHVLLFPTRYYTEGIPGTIIDAYAAGIPVIASKWESSEDVVQDRKTGFLYAFGNNNALMETLEDVVRDSEKLLQLKQDCIRAARDYLPENVLTKIKLL